MAVVSSSIEELTEKQIIQKGIDLLPELKKAIMERDVVALKRFLDEGVAFNGKDDQGYTPMHWAATYGFLDIVTLLWDKGADIRARGGKGDTAFFDDSKPIDDLNKKFTPLHSAAWNGHIDIIQFFLSQGIDVNMTTVGEQTPLHWAASAGHVEAVKLLVRNGTSVGALDKSKQTAAALAAQKSHHEIHIYLTVVPIQDCLLSAVIRNKLSEIDHLIAQGANVNTVMDDGRILLHVAAASGNVDTIRHLLDKGAEVNATDSHGSTALHWAATHGHIEAMRLLLDRGAEVNAKTQVGSTALHLAALGNHVEAIRFLVAKKAEVNAKDNTNSTPLEWAAQKNQVESIRCLAQLGADAKVLRPIVEKLWQDLLNAVVKGNVTEMDRLVKGIQLNEQNIVLLFHAAAANNQVSILRYLRSHYTVDIDCKNRFGQTPLQIAASSKHREAAQYLLDQGAQTKIKDSNGRTALYWAAINDDVDMAKILVTAGARDNEEGGATVLHFAAQKNGAAILEYFLLEQKMAVDCKNHKGQTPLQVAAGHGHKEAVACLLQHNADSNTQDNKGYTALHWAAIGGYSEIVTLLRSKKADHTIVDNEGKTARQLAETGGHKDVLSCLPEPVASLPTLFVSTSQNLMGHFVFKQQGHDSPTTMRASPFLQTALLLGGAAMVVLLALWLVDRNSAEENNEESNHSLFQR